MLFVPVNCETYDASVGLVGSTLIGRSQLKVSTSTFSAPVHTVTSDWFWRTTGASTGSRAVTNSKCRRHLSDTGEETLKTKLTIKINEDLKMWDVELVNHIITTIYNTEIFLPISVVKPGVTFRGTGREKWLEAVCKHDSRCRPWLVTLTGCPGRLWYCSLTSSSLCRLTEYWAEINIYTSTDITAAFIYK